MLVGLYNETCAEQTVMSPNEHSHQQIGFSVCVCECTQIEKNTKHVFM